MCFSAPFFILSLSATEHSTIYEKTNPAINSVEREEFSKRSPFLQVCRHHHKIYYITSGIMNQFQFTSNNEKKY